jgi:hypothetical protein
MFQVNRLAIFAFCCINRLTMKRLSYLIGFLFVSIAQLHAVESVLKGGVLYIKITGNSCPGFQLTATAQTNRFQIREKVGVICEQPFPPLKAEFTFVIGPVAAGPVYIVTQDDPFNGFRIDVPESAERLVTNAGRNSEGKFSFHINGYGNIRYIVQRTTDFITWTDTPTLIGESDFIENTAQTETPYYYRVKIMNPPATILP